MVCVICRSTIWPVTANSTVIATEVVSRAAPDGNTVLLNANAFVIAPHLRKLPYDPLTSFEPVCQLVSSPQVIAVSGASPYRSLAEMLDAARAKPSELTLASVGPASTQHIAFEMLKHLAKVNMIFVPFNGNGPAVNALLGKHVDSVLVNSSEVAEQLQDGKFRALATTSRARINSLPQVPAVAELGFDVDPSATLLDNDVISHREAAPRPVNIFSLSPRVGCRCR